MTFWLTPTFINIYTTPEIVVVESLFYSYLPDREGRIYGLSVYQELILLFLEAFWSMIKKRMTNNQQHYLQRRFFLIHFILRC